MSDDKTRRGFLQTCGAVLAGLALGRGALRAAEKKPEAGPPAGAKPAAGAAPSAQPAAAAAPARPRVVVARRPGAVAPDLKVRKEEVRPLVESALTKLTGAPDLGAAMRTLFRPEDRVGIKVNTIAGPGLSSHPEIVAVLVEGLAAAGVPANRIVIWDRTDRELERSGFPLSRTEPGPHCYGTEKDYEEEALTAGSVTTRLSQILTRRCTALITVPVLKDHGASGITGAMKNFYGVIHNPWDYHGGNCNPYIAEICSLPPIRDKHRLIVCDALIGQCQGGPGYKPEHAWPFGGVIAATDPVAHDRVVWRIIEERRKEKGLQPLKDAGREPIWLETAARLGLGVADLARIDEVPA